MRRGIRQKLLASFFAVIASLIIASGFFIIMDAIILAKYKAITDSMVSQYHLIGATDKLIQVFKDSVKFPDDPAKIQEFNDARQELKTLLIKLDGTILDADSAAVFKGLQNNINDVIAETGAGVREAAAGNYLNITVHYDAANRKNNFVQSNTAQLILKQLAYSRDLQAEIDRIRDMSQAVALALVVLTAFGCVWYAIRFSSVLIAPLGHLTELAKKIEGGDLQAVVSPDLLQGKDEVASLTNSFNTMVFFLRSNIQKLQESNQEVKRASRHLSAEKRKLQQYLDVAGVIVMIFDFNNNVLLMNKKGREVMGFSAAEITGKDWISLLVTKSQRLKTKTFINFILADVALTDTLENIVATKDGKEKNIVWHFSPLKNDRGLAEAILATGADVTELAKAQATISQLKEVDRLKSEVLNIATHELKTPLISIVGLSEVMGKDPKTIPADYQKYIDIIHQEGLKLSNLIKSMLTASRNEQGERAAVKEALDLGELLLSLDTSLQVLAQRTASKVSFQIPAGEKFPMLSDKAKISQVVYNLVDNAVKYGPKGQTMTIVLSRADDKFAKVEIHGDGPGIKPEDQKRLFLKFSQLEPSLSRSQDGMGLGLYICKQNVENLGGQIGVISASGQGATFHFTLPINGK